MVSDDELRRAKGIDILTLLPKGHKVRKTRGGYMALCTFHDETSPSMSLYRDEEGHWRYKCHGCGAKGDTVQYVRSSTGLPFEDAVYKLIDKAKTAPLRPVIVKEYTYEDEQGRPLYQVVRMEPKDFRVRQFTENGFSWCLDGIRRVLYRLPQLRMRTSDDTIYYVEGEKDVETMERAGYLATTHAGGANAYRRELLEPLKVQKRKIVVIPDNDDPGKQLMRRVFADARNDGHDVGFCLIKESTVYPEGHIKAGQKVKDVSDWVDSGRDIAELLKETK